MEQGILTGLGLAAPAGLNAWLTLLLVALAARFTGVVELADSYDWLESTPSIAVLCGLVLVETVVDKIPGADHVNDIVGTVVRPASGAWVSAATGTDAIDPTLAAVLGAVLAGTVHGAKAAARPVVTVGSLGTGNWLVSLIEDGIAVVAVVVALIVPVLVIAVLLSALGFLWWLIRRRRVRRAA
jgi:hypothetical protein